MCLESIFVLADLGGDILGRLCRDTTCLWLTWSGEEDSDKRFSIRLKEQLRGTE